MKSLLSIVLCLITLAYPSLAMPQTVPPGYRLQCRNGICRLVRIQPPAAPVVAAPVVARDVVAAVPASYVTFTVTPVDPAPLPSAPIVLAAAGNCGCALGAVCTCPPGTCACVNCPCQMAMASYQAPVVQYATASPYVYYSVAAPTVAAAYPTPRGDLTVSYDAYGTMYTSHNGGAYARRLQRHLHRGYRKFGIQ